MTGLCTCANCSANRIDVALAGQFGANGFEVLGQPLPCIANERVTEVARRRFRHTLSDPFRPPARKGGLMRQGG